MKKLLNTLKYLVALAVGITLFWLVYKDIPISMVWNGIKQANYFWILLALVVSLTGHYSRGVRWNLLFRPLGYNVKSSKTFSAVMIGYAANFALPRMGEVTRCLVINRSEKIPLNNLIGTVIVERVFDFLTLVLLTVITFAIEFGKIKDFLYKALNVQSGRVGKYFTITNLLIAFLLIAAFITLLFLIKKSKRAFKKHPFYVKIRGMISGFYEGMISIKTMERKWEFIGHTLYIWLTYYLMTYLVFFALAPTSGLSPFAGLSTLVISSIGFIMPVQGGIGTYHFMVKEALLLYGINASDGSLYAFIAHSSQMFFILIVAAICFLVLLYVQRKNKNESLSTDKI